MYAGRGLSLDGGGSGTNRCVNVSLPTVDERQAADPLTPSDPDVLPGQVDITAPDGPGNAECGLPVGRRAARQPYRARLRLLR